MEVSLNIYQLPIVYLTLWWVRVVNKHYTDSALKELVVLGGKQSHEQNECDVSTVLEGGPELWGRRVGVGGLS